MTNTKEIIFIRQNIFGKCIDLFLLLMSCGICLCMLSPIIDNLIQREFVIASVLIFYFTILVFFAYSSIININNKVGFAPNAIILTDRKIRQIWNYDDIDWLSCSYGEVDLPHNKFGKYLKKLFFKPIMEGVTLSCRGKIANLSLFSSSEFRRLAKIHLEPHKIITHIQTQKILSEKSRLTKILYKMPDNPYYMLLAIFLLFVFFLFALIGELSSFSVDRVDHTPTEAHVKEKYLYMYEYGSNSEFKDWAADIPGEYFRSFLDKWRERTKKGSDIKEMNEFLKRECGNWIKS